MQECGGFAGKNVQWEIWFSVIGSWGIFTTHAPYSILSALLYNAVVNGHASRSHIHPQTLLPCHHPEISETHDKKCLGHVVLIIIKKSVFAPHMGQCYKKEKPFRTLHLDFFNKFTLSLKDWSPSNETTVSGPGKLKTEMKLIKIKCLFVFFLISDTTHCHMHSFKHLKRLCWHVWVWKVKKEGPIGNDFLVFPSQPQKVLQYAALLTFLPIPCVDQILSLI